MPQMISLAILLLFAPFCIFANPEQPKNASAQNPPAASPVKNGTAPGRYGGGGGYATQQYSSGEYEVAYGHSQRLIDDYVCDLDASILVVTNSDKKYQKESNGQQQYGGGYGQKEEYGGKSGYAAGRAEGKRGKRGAANYEGEGGGGYGRRGEYGQRNNGGYGGNYGQKDYGHTNEYSVAKAHRLRCSAIAVNSDEDCKKCCHMAARKERSMSKESIIGFIVDYDEIRQPSNGYEPSGPYRMKRNAEPVYPPAAKPEDYQYNAGGGYGQSGGNGNNYGQQSGAGQSYGQGGGYGEGQGGGDYQSYGGGNTYSYNYPQRPKNARCVCCAPKASSNGEYGTGYGNKEGGGGNENYGGEYDQEENGNGYGGEDYGSAESGQEGGGRYGPRGLPSKRNYGEEEEYGGQNDRRGEYSNEGRHRQYGQGGGEYGGNGRKGGRKYGGNKGGPY